MPLIHSKGWTSDVDLKTLQLILHQVTPQWPNSPCKWQIQSVTNVLNKINQLVVTGCGEGKIAAAYLLILIYQELLKDPTLFEFGLNKISVYPIEIMVSPLSDLVISQIAKMKHMGVKAITLDTETINSSLSHLKGS
ncbi:hypothetical protein C8Q75DRAFT_804400 [Abortiporus biennis]|nr:hypothetical protein C8Q75DRAFT_804400 [Abortiporus biennis]